MPVPESILYLTESDVQQTLTMAETVDLAEIRDPRRRRGPGGWGQVLHGRRPGRFRQALFRLYAGRRTGLCQDL